MRQSFTVSAPGSVMLTGEHAVVYGYPALVCAIEQRIHVRIAPLADRKLEIHSEIAPTYEATLDDIVPSDPLRFVIAALKQYSPQIETGFSLHISSQIDPTMGLGSSAAVTVACLTAFDRWAGLSSRETELHLRALAIVRGIQGRGSGADLAASLMGGMISYQLPPHLLTGTPLMSDSAADIVAMPQPPTLSLKYSGYKTPTGEVLSRIANAMIGREDVYQTLYARMGDVAQQTIDAARQENWDTVARCLAQYQTLMVELGVSDETLDAIIQDAHAAMAAKISGSGLGDCVIAMGEMPHGFTHAPLAQNGVIIDG